MKDIKPLVEKVLKDCESLGIEYGNIISITTNSRAKSRWGHCRKKCDGYYIDINTDLLADNIEDAGALDTIAHEVCHTIKGCMNHGTEWKKYAKLLGTYGYNVKRTNTAEEKGITQDTSRRLREYKYAITCPKCGKVWRFFKQTRTVTAIMHNPNSHYYFCPNCHSVNLQVTKNKAK